MDITVAMCDREGGGECEEEDEWKMKTLMEKMNISGNHWILGFVRHVEMRTKKAF